MWIFETTKLKNIYKHASSQQEKHKEKKRVNKTSCMEHSYSWKDILGFKEIYAIIFET